MKRLFLAFTFILLGNFNPTILYNSLVQAQDQPTIAEKKTERKRVFAKTRTTKPLTIYLYPFAGNHPRKINGEVAVNSTLKNPEKIVFYLETKYREQLWRKELMWRDRFEKDKKIKIPFVFDLPERNIENELRLKAVIHAQYEKVLAEGENRIQLPDLKKEALAFSAINNLTLIKGNNVTSGSFIFTNKSIEAPLKAQITIKPETLSQTEAQTVVVEIDPIPIEEKRTITFEFPTPEQPKVYGVGVQVFTDDNIPLSGILEKKFLVQGLFAEVINFDYEPKNHWKTDSDITINFSGEINDPLIKEAEARIKIFSHKAQAQAGKGLNELIYEKNEKITINRYRQITGTSMFKAPWNVEQLKGSIEFLAKGQVIGIFDFTTPVYPASAKTISQQIITTIIAPLSENESLSTIQKIVIMVGIIIFMVGIIFLIIFLVKKSHKKHLILFLCLTVPLTQLQAENRHFMHFDNEVYTSSASQGMSTGDENFRLIPVRGIVEVPDTDAKFTPESSIITESYIFPPGTIIPDPLPYDSAELVNIHGAIKKDSTFTAETQSDYFYEVNIENDPNFNTEGEYRLARIDFDNGVVLMSLDFEVNTEYAFSIDQTAPNVTFNVTNLSDKTLLNPDLFNTLSDEQKVAQVADYFVSDAVKVTVDCDEDCPEDGNFFEVIGNFCSQPSICDAVGVRSFIFCDNIMNCSDPIELELKHFDGVAPSFTNFELILQDDASVKRVGDDTTALKVNEKYTFTILDSTEGTTIDNNLVDSHACGGGSNDITADDFFDNGTNCQQKNFSCSLSSTQRGSEDIVNNPGTCNASCDSGMVPYYCGPNDPNGPNGPKNCCLPACKFSFPYCFPLPFY